MRVIGVIDLMGGRAVHAIGGTRDKYAPVQASAGDPIHGDAVTLARLLVERFGLTELYAADLDAILGGQPQDETIRAISAIAPIWVDAGVSTTRDARHLLDLGVSRVIVGLETLHSYDALERTCAEVGADRIAFSLDLREGVPITSRDRSRFARPDSAATIGESPIAIAARAAALGIKAIIVLDLARVGVRAGLDLNLFALVRKAAPDVMLLAGGGVRGVDDLLRLADAGCDGALVATALHDGRLTAKDIASLPPQLHLGGTRRLDDDTHAVG
jgi:phosphoribosylformimino-5-aminoimidazole carboxamide ribotide isomerase